MNKYQKTIVIVISLYLIFLGIFSFISRPETAESIEYQKEIFGNPDANIKLLFFISSDDRCEKCDAADEKIFNEIMPGNETKISFEKYKVDFTDQYKNNFNLFISFNFQQTPTLVVRNESVGKQADILLTYTNIVDDINYTLKKAVKYHLTGNYSENFTKSDSNIVFDSFFGKINASEYSLPVLTIVLGAMDSINPCSFFVLLFLLSILLYTKSRKRMILIGGIFVFFSGLIYYMIMAVILNLVLIAAQQLLITILAGIIAIIFGILNIKDFFYFKKGPTASIPDSKKKGLYSQMRKIVKITSIPSLIIATIILSISANSVELLCSLNLPVIYTAILTSYSLSGFSFYMYIFFYNLIYVIPLIIIVAIVVITLGKWKLSEFQGKMLKLFSGIMIFSLGIILLINPSLLSDFMVAIIILLSSFLLTYFSYFISKILQKADKAI